MVMNLDGRQLNVNYGLPPRKKPFIRKPRYHEISKNNTNNVVYSAVKSLDGVDLDGRNIQVSVAVPPQTRLKNLVYRCNFVGMFSLGMYVLDGKQVLCFEVVF